MVGQEGAEGTALLSPALFRRHCISHKKKEKLLYYWISICIQIAHTQRQTKYSNTTFPEVKFFRLS